MNVAIENTFQYLEDELEIRVESIKADIDRCARDMSMVSDRYRTITRDNICRIRILPIETLKPDIPCPGVCTRFKELRYSHEFDTVIGVLVVGNLMKDSRVCRVLRELPDSTQEVLCEFQIEQDDHYIRECHDRKTIIVYQYMYNELWTAISRLLMTRISLDESLAINTVEFMYTGTTYDRVHLHSGRYFALRPEDHRVEDRYSVRLYEYFLLETGKMPTLIDSVEIHLDGEYDIGDLVIYHIPGSSRLLEFIIYIQKYWKLFFAI